MAPSSGTTLILIVCSGKEFWSELLDEANQELALPPPPRLGDCGGRWDAWQASTQTDPNDYAAMKRRIAARQIVGWCIDEWQKNHEQLAARQYRASRGEIVAGALLLGFGAAGLGASTAVGVVWSRDGALSPIGAIYPAVGGTLSGIMVVLGAVLVGFGIKHRGRK